jgi:hypothetical protein
MRLASKRLAKFSPPLEAVSVVLPAELRAVVVWFDMVCGKSSWSFGPREGVTPTVTKARGGYRFPGPAGRRTESQSS